MNAATDVQVRDERCEKSLLLVSQCACCLGHKAWWENQS